MAPSCFLRQRELFTEAALRGWLAAMLDFPRMRRRSSAIEEASQSVPDQLRSEVCCIPTDDASYRLLVTTAWVSAYKAVAQQSDRASVPMVAWLKGRTQAEALAHIRQGFPAQAKALDAAFAQYQESIK